MNKNKPGRKKGEPTHSTSMRINKKAYIICKKKYGRKLNAEINKFIVTMAEEIKK